MPLRNKLFFGFRLVSLRCEVVPDEMQAFAIAGVMAAIMEPGADGGAVFGAAGVPNQHLPNPLDFVYEEVAWDQGIKEAEVLWRAKRVGFPRDVAKGAIDHWLELGVMSKAAGRLRISKRFLP